MLKGGRPGNPGERRQESGGCPCPKLAWDGGGAGSRVAKAPGTFGERLEKFVYWHFRSVEISSFHYPFSCFRVSAPTCFLLAGILPPARVGMGGKTFSFIVGYFLNQT